MRISYSKLRAWMSCPKQYEFAYVVKIRGAPNDSMKAGRFVHSVLEWKYHHQDLPIEEYLVSNLPSSEEELQEQSEYISTIKGIMDGNFFKNTIKVEYSLEFEYEGYLFKTIIDRLDFDGSNYFIYDYKFGKMEYKGEKFSSPMYMVQPILYAYAIMDKFNVDKVEFRYYNVFHNTMATKVITKDTLDMETVMRLIKDIENAEQSTEFTANIGYQCAGCVYRHLCTDFKRWFKDNYGKHLTSTTLVDLLKNRDNILEEGKKRKFDKFVESYMSSHGISSLQYDEDRFVTVEDGLIRYE